MRFEAVRVEGLSEFRRALRKLDTGLPKGLRLAMNDAVGVVVDYARAEVPRRSGRAAKSIRAKSTGTAARASAGGNRAPYFPWLDFGGRTGPRRSVDRPFYKEGRYLWKGLVVKREQFTAGLEDALGDVARRAGLEVD